jgi:UDP-glucose 4-epimerase
MINALVTGGAGFVGSHLVDSLVGSGHHVTVVDNLSKGYLSNLKESLASVSFVNGSVLDVDLLKSVTKDQDVIFHLAATQDFRNSLKDHHIDFKNNAEGTLNLLEAAYNNGVHDFIFAQTTALYGENDGTLMPETYVGVQTNLYGATKLAAGAFAEAYTQFSPMRLWTFRFGRALGPRERKGAVWDFVGKLKRDPYHLEVLGNGKQSRQYIHVQDLVSGILYGYANSSEKVNIFNLSTEELVTIDQLTDIVVEALGLEHVRRTYTSDQPRGYIGDNPNVHLSTDRMKALGWSPKRTAREAIVDNTLWAAKEQGFILQ